MTIAAAGPEPVRWLLVGAGDIARKRVAPALAHTAGSALAAVCAPRAEAAQALAGPYGAAAFTDLEQALAQSGAEAVYVATPVDCHADHALLALKAGLAVLVEKPLTRSAAECQPLVAAAEQAGVTAGCAYYRRLSARYRHAQQALASGVLGQLLTARLIYHGWFAPAPDDPKYWRVVRARSGGGPLSDVGSHMLDVLIGLCGLPVSVSARCGNLVHAWDVEDTASVLLTMPNGAQVTGSFSWSAQTWQHELELMGSAAHLAWRPFDSGPVTLTTGQTAETHALPPADNVHGPLIEDFVQAMRTGRPPACPLAAAAQTNRVLDAIYQSAAEDRVIQLTP